jgi:hypothetical protein
MGLAGFPERPFRDDDPLVCTCAATIGTQVLTKKENRDRLAEVMAAHDPEHKRRLRHQARHRTLDSACPECPTVHDSTCRHA